MKCKLSVNSLNMLGSADFWIKGNTYGKLCLVVWCMKGLCKCMQAWPLCPKRSESTFRHRGWKTTSVTVRVQWYEDCTWSCWGWKCSPDVLTLPCTVWTGICVCSAADGLFRSLPCISCMCKYLVCCLQWSWIIFLAVLLIAPTPILVVFTKYELFLLKSYAARIKICRCSQGGSSSVRLCLLFAFQEGLRSASLVGPCTQLCDILRRFESHQLPAWSLKPEMGRWNANLITSALLYKGLREGWASLRVYISV